MFEDVLLHKELLLKLYDNWAINADECPKSFIKHNIVKLEYADNAPYVAKITSYGRKFIEGRVL